ncbi:acyl-CoA dehydrogenase family protein [Mycolicibacterium confluentis]|uniref:Acyl-CoA dehydrogenase n=1 Tax=Mycolicibacterium confluentis TaxID=28047 RepID=A0A7I7Y3A7_9MYCO|nr:acyl-CoA dehydrogenase family protein [Mycolicibacterium confluentis]MCV7318206.1 acyl-CoA/acyl-ACP dehydrogenase [Mycolicibacterium confluentis]ORV29543.1 acyl-CoA dehydrogenase [Mycolicibacterium confluentis]BBZ36116.1 acyl-CoA dehydrogenase [Mycolicibacterium confluentis]
MTLDFSDLHDELRSVAGDLLGKERGGAVALNVLAQAGWTGLEIGENFGGAGATFREVAIIGEEMGRVAVASGFLGAAVLSAGLLNELQPSGLRDRLLSGLAAGTAGVATVISGEHRDFEPAFRVDSAGRVSGSAAFVSDVVGASGVLLPAVGVDGDVVVAAAQGEQLSVVDQAVLDETRSLATVSADSVPAEVLTFAGDPVSVLGAVRDRACVALACDSLGVAAAMLDATVDYVKVREQFDRPIGSFQAVKHACADMLVRVTVARQLVSAASVAVAQGDPDASRAAAKAKAYCGEAAVEVAGKAMQLHGGIGYTWESGIHTYLKRATLNRALFGGPSEHRAFLTQTR